MLPVPARVPDGVYGAGRMPGSGPNECRKHAKPGAPEVGGSGAGSIARAGRGRSLGVPVQTGTSPDVGRVGYPEVMTLPISRQ